MGSLRLVLSIAAASRVALGPFFSVGKGRIAEWTSVVLKCVTDTTWKTLGLWFLYCTNCWPSEDVLTYFCLSHVDLVSLAFLSAKGGDSLDKFLEEMEKNGIHFSVSETYNAEVLRHHQCFMNGDDSWPAYEKDHYYPLVVRITR